MCDNENDISVESTDDPMDFEITQPSHITPPTSQTSVCDDNDTDHSTAQEPVPPNHDPNTNFVTKSDLQNAVAAAFKLHEQPSPDTSAVKLINESKKN